MRAKKFKKRFYRDWVSSKKMFKQEVVVEETDLQILSDRPVEKGFIASRVRFYRDQIQEYINYKDRRFLTALKPLTVELNAPAIVKEMARQSKKADVGPMASVAGAIAGYLGKDLLRKGLKDVIVENGGDIFIKVSDPVNVGLYAGRSRLSGSLSLRIRPQDTPLGICASSGTVGHSLSFGRADIAIIIANNCVLADAAATATANRINSKSDLHKAIEYARSIKGIKGAVAIIGNNIASWGRVEFVK
jgi:hypothetical protein